MQYSQDSHGTEVVEKANGNCRELVAIEAPAGVLRKRIRSRLGKRAAVVGWVVGTLLFYTIVRGLGGKNFFDHSFQASLFVFECRLRHVIMTQGGCTIKRCTTHDYENSVRQRHPDLLSSSPSHHKTKLISRRGRHERLSPEKVHQCTRRHRPSRYRSERWRFATRNIGH